MRRWDSDPGLQRLVTEHRAGVIGRREFLARLGATTSLGAEWLLNLGRDTSLSSYVSNLT